ncbi:hypothetical protein DLM45_03165 [Hyphomicrobium methylovorum]|uniref:hypothetical protein n=1 Tax=Hyphomicrobium methylovorum TaxID=84 RepID=UPI0015E6C66A|nr:hypothetical protein [Hyphomicrobium methylovorum]MBA2125224.1 hypothetical protein [Hyphomicrobium methylovorum]
MKRTLTKIATGCASAALLLGVSTISANAYYMGYANGDPGNWVFCQEQHNGASPPETSQVMPGPDDYYGRRIVRHERPTHAHLRMDTRRRTYE